MTTSPWNCASCTLENPARGRRCTMCGTRRPASSSKLHGWLQRNRKRQQEVATTTKYVDKDNDDNDENAGLLVARMPPPENQLIRVRVRVDGRLLLLLRDSSIAEDHEEEPATKRRRRRRLETAQGAVCTEDDSTTTTVLGTPPAAGTDAAAATRRSERSSTVGGETLVVSSTTTRQREKQRRTTHSAAPGVIRRSTRAGTKRSRGCCDHIDTDPPPRTAASSSPNDTFSRTNKAADTIPAVDDASSCQKEEDRTTHATSTTNQTQDDDDDYSRSLGLCTQLSPPTTTREVSTISAEAEGGIVAATSCCLPLQQQHPTPVKPNLLLQRTSDYSCPTTSSGCEMGHGKGELTEMTTRSFRSSHVADVRSTTSCTAEVVASAIVDSARNGGDDDDDHRIPIRDGSDRSDPVRAPSTHRGTLPSCTNANTITDDDPVVEAAVTAEQGGGAVRPITGQSSGPTIHPGEMQDMATTEATRLDPVPPGAIEDCAAADDERGMAPGERPNDKGTQPLAVAPTTTTPASRESNPADSNTNALEAMDSNVAAATTTQTERPVGFHTAGTQTAIVVSAQAKDAANLLLQQQHRSTTVDKGSIEQLSSGASSSSRLHLDDKRDAVGGTAISVTAKAKIILHRNSSSNKEPQNIEHAEARLIPRPGVGFQTAGRGTTISVTAASMAKAKRIIDCPAAGRPGDSNPKAIVANSSKKKTEFGSKLAPSSTAGFQTAGRRTAISISAASLAKAKTIMGGPAINKLSAIGNSNEPSTEGKEVGANKLPKGAPSGVGGFQTAGRRTAITVTAESLNQAKNIMEGSAPRRCSGTRYSSAVPGGRERPTAQSHERRLDPPCVGFQTAGHGAAVTVSAESMAKATSILSTTLDAATAISNVQTTRTDPAPPVVGFQTAGLKAKISVSEESIARAKSILNSSKPGREADATNFLSSFASNASHKTAGPDLNEIMRDQEPGPKVPEEIPAGESSMAKSVASANSSKRVKSGFISVTASTEPISTCAKTELSPFVGFQTAGRRTAIAVTAESVAKAKRLIDGPSSTTGQHSNFAPSSNDPSGSIQKPGEAYSSKSAGLSSPALGGGFQTAGRQTAISVSAEALAKAKSIINVPKNNEQHSECYATVSSSDPPVAAGNQEPRLSRTPSVFGFQTAGRRRGIAVTAESLAKAKTLMNETYHSEESHHCVLGAFFQAPVSGKSLAEEMFLAENKFGSPNTSNTKPDDIATSNFMQVSNRRNFVGKTHGEQIEIGAHADTAQPQFCYSPPSQSQDSIATEKTPSRATDGTNEEKAGQANLSVDPSMPLSSPKKSIADTTGRFAAAICNTRHSCFRSTESSKTIAASEEPVARVRSADNDETVSENMVDSSEGTSPWRCTARNSPPTPHTLQLKQSMETIDHRCSDRSSDGCELDTANKPPSTVEESLTSTCTPHHSGATRGILRHVGGCTTRSCMQTGNRKSGDRHSVSFGKVSEFLIQASSPLRMLPAISRTPEQNPTLFCQTRCSSHTGGKSAEPLSTMVTPWSHRDPQLGCSIYSGIAISQSTPQSPALYINRDCSPAAPFAEAFRSGMFENREVDLSSFGVSPTTELVSSQNAVNVRFDLQKMRPVFLYEGISGLLCGSTADYERELARLGCKSSMINKRWIETQTRWIIWKMACTERKFPQYLGGKYLQFGNVVNQLHRRFSVEVAGGSRSVVRKLLNRDIPASTMMTLCVARIKPFDQNPNNDEGHEFVCFELTDGWYSVLARGDGYLKNFVKTDTITVGSKLTVSNSILEGFDNGIDPLDDTFDPFDAAKCPVLQLVANGTRVARWDATLGRSLQTKADGLLLTRCISDILDGGGCVPLLDITVAERHPLMFLERKDNEKSNILTEKQENIRVEKCERQRQLLIDKHIDAIQLECEQEIDDDAPECWRKLMKCGFSDDAVGCLDPQALRELNHWKDKRVSRLRRMVEQEVEAKLEEVDFCVTPSRPFLRLVVTDYEKHQHDCGTGDTRAILTIWCPTENHLASFKEGESFRLRNLSTSFGRYEGLPQFTIGSKSSFSLLPKTPPMQSRDSCNHPKTSPCANIFTISFRNDLWSETKNVNLVAAVVQCHDGAHVDCLHVTDRTGLHALIVAVGSNTGSFNDIVVGTTVELQALSLKSRQPLTLEFCESSRLECQPKCRDADLVRTWVHSNAGRKRIRQLRAILCVDRSYVTRKDKDCVYIIGYIANYMVDPELGLVLLIDCGARFYRSCTMPLDTLSRSCFGGFRFDFPSLLSEAAQIGEAQLKRCGARLCSQRQLYRFCLRASRNTIMDTNSAVLSVSTIDKRDLSELYDSAAISQ